ncbi:MAG TPA: hypothetical protein ACFYD6_11130 [Candidatus Brocadiia bacterium]|nr:hypothetical protein [Planctomycetota bacterium]MDO8092976.1 hypothetical protein [Candidatus Brocadiales bacterium]
MKKLLYVPIIHMSADMGSVSASIDKKGTALCGEENWKRHKETVASLWGSISNYLDTIDANGLKIYQDGLVENGELGMKIVQDGVSKGSKNYEIISRLIQRGAKLIKTEELSIIMKEYGHVIKIAQAKSSPERLIAALKYKFEKGKLLKGRDEFIARRINETLNDGETGIIFIGAQHEIIPRLSKDIEVQELKKREKLQRYQRTLLYARRRKAQFEELAKYLSSPIS